MVYHMACFQPVQSLQIVDQSPAPAALALKDNASLFQPRTFPVNVAIVAVGCANFALSTLL